MGDSVNQFSVKFSQINTCNNSVTGVVNDGAVSDHSSNLKDLEDKVFELDCRVIECEQYPRRENIVISGIPDTIHHEDLKETIIDICDKIGLNVTESSVTQRSFEMACKHHCPFFLTGITFNIAY